MNSSRSLLGGYRSPRDGIQNGKKHGQYKRLTSYASNLLDFGKNHWFTNLLSIMEGWCSSTNIWDDMIVWNFHGIYYVPQTYWKKFLNGFWKLSLVAEMTIIPRWKMSTVWILRQRLTLLYSLVIQVMLINLFLCRRRSRFQGKLH